MSEGPLCQWEGCEEPANAGRFGRTYCEPHAQEFREQRREQKNANRRVSQENRQPRTSGSLKGQIRDAVLGTSAIVAISDPRIYIAVEATVDEFAAAWDNVAKQSPSARRYIEAMLNGGVWIGALGATMVMAVSVLAVTDRLPPSLHPLGHYCIGHAGIEISQVPPGGNGASPAAPPPSQPADVFPPSGETV